jgi:hypothetical protein
MSIDKVLWHSSFVNKLVHKSLILIKIVVLIIFLFNVINLSA